LQNATAASCGVKLELKRNVFIYCVKESCINQQCQSSEGTS